MTTPSLRFTIFGRIISRAGCRFVYKLIYPFQCDLPYFILIWALLLLPDVAVRLVNAEIGSAVCFAMAYYVIAYMLVFILDLHRIVGKILKPAVYLVVLLFTAFDFYCMLMYKDRLTHDIVQIVAATNPAEVYEYVRMYISWGNATIFLFYLAAGIAVLVLTFRMQLKLRRRELLAPVLLLIVSCMVTYANPLVKQEIRTGWNFQLDEIIDLNQYSTYPAIETFGDSGSPTHVVVILGESFAPSHSSLYGYDKVTNPLLQKLYEQGDLTLFYQVNSPGTNTSQVFRYLLNTYQTGKEETCRWYESTNLVEVLKTGGYHTTWISNQYEFGRWDNIPANHAKLCDSYVFLSQEVRETYYDGSLTGKELAADKPCHAVFYHLMGQHYLFQERYPEEYEVFKPSDYPCGIRQGEVLASYDNATLYNDHVVKSIIDKYKDFDAVVFYLSDHGLDLFDTDAEFCGHARRTPESQAICKKIPFMVYLSPLYQQLRPETTARIKKAANKTFCTDKLIYSVMDAAGLRFAGNDEVAEYSLFCDVE